jgi:hypothetical protein
LIEQTYPGRADHEAHFRALLPAFSDSRYMRVEGKPLFLIHRPAHLPDAAATLDLWRAMAADAGLGGLHIAGISFSPDSNLTTHGFDAEVAQPGFALRQPVSRRQPLRWMQRKIEIWRGMPTFKPYESFIESFESFAKRHMSAMTPKRAWYPCVTHAWDNTPRSGRNGLVLVGATPKLFLRVLNIAMYALEGRPSDQRLLFLKSWNEWAEGNHLEPDLQFGTGFLQAVADSLGVESEVKTCWEQCSDGESTQFFNNSHIERAS